MTIDSRIQNANLERKCLELQETINDLQADRQQLKQELLAHTRARNLLGLRIENAISYLSGSAHHAARIGAAMMQLQQAQEGR